MDVSEKLVRYRYHISIAIAISVLFCMVLYAAPRIVSILAHFWPLFASTTVLLVSTIAFGFGGVSKLSADHDDEAHGEGEGLLDYYVAARAEYSSEQEAQSFRVRNP